MTRQFRLRGLPMTAALVILATAACSSDDTGGGTATDTAGAADTGQADAGSTVDTVASGDTAVTDAGGGDKGKDTDDGAKDGGPGSALVDKCGAPKN